MVQLLAGIISLRRVRGPNPGRSHGSADTLPLRHSANLGMTNKQLGGRWNETSERSYEVTLITGTSMYSALTGNYIVDGIDE